MDDLQTSLTDSISTHLDGKIDDLKKSVNASIKGTIGNILKEGYAEGSQLLDAEARAQIAEMTPGEQFKTAIMARISKFLAGD